MEFIERRRVDLAREGPRQNNPRGRPRRTFLGFRQNRTPRSQKRAAPRPTTPGTRTRASGTFAGRSSPRSTAAWGGLGGGDRVADFVAAPAVASRSWSLIARGPRIHRETSGESRTRRTARQNNSRGRLRRTYLGLRDNRTPRSQKRAAPRPTTTATRTRAFVTFAGRSRPRSTAARGARRRRSSRRLRRGAPTGRPCAWSSGGVRPPKGPSRDVGLITMMP